MAHVYGMVTLWLGVCNEVLWDDRSVYMVVARNTNQGQYSDLKLWGGGWPFQHSPGPLSGLLSV